MPELSARLNTISSSPVQVQPLPLPNAPRPVAMVSYKREACHGTFDPEARVTFDRQIRCQATAQPRVELHGTSWDLVEGRRVILEFKFNNRCPSWMTSAIQTFALQRVSYSKYAHSVLTARRASPLLADA